MMPLPKNILITCCIISVGFPCWAFCVNTFSMESGCKKIVNQHHHGLVVNVKPGDCLRLTLPNPGSGGYLIQHPPGYNHNVLSLHETNKIPPPQSGREGNFGSYEWRFQADHTGISRLVVRAARPWETDKNQMVIFEATIEVTQ